MITYKDLGHKGRLGNCLFEAAATIALAVRNGDDYVFPEWDQAKYFNIPLKHFRANVEFTNIYMEPHFHYASIPYKKSLNLYGYFQSEKYFADCKDLIRDLLTPKMPAQIIPNTVALHVRRGDYLKLGNCFNILDTKYYHKALEEVGARKIMVFSEDMDWCEKNFKGNEFNFMTGNAPHVDIALQSVCEHNIIANSSFSWWGAWLNRNPNKKVIAPKNWFGPELEPTHNTKDLIPEEWVLL